MPMRFILALLYVSSATAGDCFTRKECDTLLDQYNADLREQITDTLQREVENNLAAAPAVVAVTQSMFQDGLLPTDMSIERNEVAVLESSWYQLKNFEELDWIYYGDVSGIFLGFRRAYPCEYNSQIACDYGSTTTATTPAPLLTNNTLVRLRTGAGNTLSAYSTDPSGNRGGDTIDLLYTENNYSIAQRQWYKKGINDGEGWTNPYLFSGGKIGISFVKKITDPTSSKTMGVLAADYELEFLDKFIREISVVGSSTLFIVAANGDLLASNKNAKITFNNNGVDTIVKAAESEDNIIKEMTLQIFKVKPVLNQPSGDWSEVTTKTLVGTHTIGDVEYYYDSIGVAYGELKWSVVIISQASDFYKLTPSTNPCMDWLHCRSALRSANSDKRERKLSMLLTETRSYLGTAVVAVNTIDQTYNNGQLAASWCDPCGKIDITNVLERRNLLNHIKHTMEIYNELIWLYIGFKTGQFAGYKRVDGKLKLWTCHPPNSFDAAGCKNVALYDSDVEPLTLSGTSFVVEKPIDKPWFTMPDKHNLSQYELLWTDAYPFGTGEIGISVVKKGFGGDWKTTSELGVWGADFSLSFLSNFISEFEADKGVILYILNEKKELLAYSIEGKAQELNSTLTHASQSDPLVKASAEILRDTTETVHSQLLEIDDEIYYMNSVLLTDSDSQLVRTYKWDFVMVTPEASLYSYEAPSSGDSSMAKTIIIIVVGIVVVGILIVAIYRCKDSCCSNEKSDQGEFFFGQPTDEEMKPTEPADAYQRQLSL